MEWLSLLLFSGVLGVRHGFDPDHVAAITDMVGSHQRVKRGMTLGFMYAAGHGLVVLLIGLLAIYAGRTLPESLVRGTEFLVGVSLVVLGALILRSLVKERGNYQYTSRWQLAYELVQRVLKKGAVPADGWKKLQIGLIGAMVIGVVHGLGAETPTQLVVIGHSSQVGNLLMSGGILLTFVVGLLLSTSAVSLITTWGFFKARSMRLLNLAMGAAAGGYSLFLGVQIMLGA